MLIFFFELEVSLTIQASQVNSLQNIASNFFTIRIFTESLEKAVLTFATILATSLMLNCFKATKRNMLLYFTGSFIWNNCMWNHEFKNMVWTTAFGLVPFSSLDLKVCNLVFASYFVLRFSGQVYVHLRVETHAGYE